MHHHPRHAADPAAQPRIHRLRAHRGLVLLASLLCTVGLVVGSHSPTANAAGILSSELRPASTTTGTRPVNLGVKFSPSADGTVVALQFYRTSRQTRAYTGSLWTSSGRLLGQLTFPESSTSGWQTARFASPIAIRRSGTYVASYLASDGQFAITRGGLSTGFTRSGITVPRNGGVYRYSSSSMLPTSSVGSNYFVDVVYYPVTTSPAPSGSLTATQARAAATKRVFFGHQSIGGNVMKGMAALYDSLGVNDPPTVQLNNQSASGLPSSGAVLSHAYVGANGRPMGKIQAFEAYLRAGVGSRVDVAVLKFCYADIRGARGADYASVTELFNAYAAMMTRLERDFPNVTFVYATAPVENVQLKPETAEYNANRARYNALIRQRYAATGRLWDIARAESTAPDGTRITSTWNGQRHEALYRNYTQDGGHLVDPGTRVAATPLMQLIARG